MKKENLRKKGAVYEDRAALFLQEKGYQILERNFYTRQGEIDIVAKDGEALVFTEVKYRKKDDYGNPLDCVGYTKQRTICKVSRVYINMNGADFDVPIRYDVIAVNDSGDGTLNVNWLKNAFEYVL